MQETIKILVLNAQDLFLFFDKLKDQSPLDLNEQKWQLASSSLSPNKTKEKSLQLAQTILETNSDIVMVTEVGGAESLENFSKYLLKGDFFTHCPPSNSDRGIDLGFLVKKSLPFEFQFHSYFDSPFPDIHRKFSRGVLRLDLIKEGAIQAIFLLVHIKSKLDLRKTDFEGRSQRAFEIKSLIQIYQNLQKLAVPIFIGGDFNGNASEIETEEEFRPIYEMTDLKDICYLTNLPTQERFSYVYFSKSGNRFLQQIDYLFVSKKFKSLLVSNECFFPRYKNLEGGPLAIPKKMEHKNLIPSDHYPFLATLKISFSKNGPLSF
jgi:hypothetical protein